MRDSYRIIASRSVSPSTRILGFCSSVRMDKSAFDISSRPTSSRHLSCNLCLYNNFSWHAETLPDHAYVFKLELGSYKCGNPRPDPMPAPQGNICLTKTTRRDMIHCVWKLSASWSCQAMPWSIEYQCGNARPDPISAGTRPVLDPSMSTEL